MELIFNKNQTNTTTLWEIKLCNTTTNKGKWNWVIDPSNVFLVKSLYMALWENSPSGRGREEFGQTLHCKRFKFSWQLILRTLPTRGNLSRRGVVFEELTLSCIWCLRILEVEDHLFCRCSFGRSVWYDIFRWVGGHISCLSFKWSHPPYYFATSSSNKNTRIIWHATARKIWEARKSLQRWNKL